MEDTDDPIRRGVDATAEHHSDPGGTCSHGYGFGSCEEWNERFPPSVPAMCRQLERALHEGGDPEAGGFDPSGSGRLDFGLAPRLEPLSAPPSGGGTSSTRPGNFEEFSQRMDQARRAALLPEYSLDHRPSAEELAELVSRGLSTGRIQLAFDGSRSSSQLVAVVSWPGGCRYLSAVPRASSPLLWEGDQA